MCDRCQSHKPCKKECLRTVEPTKMGSSAKKLGYRLCKCCGHYVKPKGAT